MWSMIVSWPTITLAISSRTRWRASHRRATMVASSLESALGALGWTRSFRGVSIGQQPLGVACVAARLVARSMFHAEGGGRFVGTSGLSCSFFRVRFDAVAEYR